MGTTGNAGPHTAAIITFELLVEAIIRPHNAHRETQPPLTWSTLAPIHVSCSTIFNIIDLLPLFLPFFSLLTLAPYPMIYIQLTSLRQLYIIRVIIHVIPDTYSLSSPSIRVCRPLSIVSKLPSPVSRLPSPVS